MYIIFDVSVLLQTNKLTRAMTAAHHAELVALQLSLINSLPLGQGADCLLELDSAQVAYMVTHKLRCVVQCVITKGKEVMSREKTV